MKNDYKIFQFDPYLIPYRENIELRMNLYKAKKEELVGKRGSLTKFANGYKYFGFHRTRNGWVYREWAPAADRVCLAGDFNNWNVDSHPLERKENGIFEIELEGKDALKVGQKIQAIVYSGGNMLRRIPSYATRVVQDTNNYIWCAEIEEPCDKFQWTDKDFKAEKIPFIYECHIGMSSEEGKVCSYREFIENVLPRIKKLGYNTIQIMAIAEYPYYGSFGYQVSNFFCTFFKIWKIFRTKGTYKHCT